jgi:hypothetical protein
LGVFHRARQLQRHLERVEPSGEPSPERAFD